MEIKTITLPTRDIEVEVYAPAEKSGKEVPKTLKPKRSWRDLFSNKKSAEEIVKEAITERVKENIVEKVEEAITETTVEEKVKEAIEKIKELTLEEPSVEEKVEQSTLEEPSVKKVVEDENETELKKEICEIL
jgi:hypothetical protein